MYLSRILVRFCSRCAISDNYGRISHGILDLGRSECSKSSSVVKNAFDYAYGCQALPRKSYTQWAVQQFNARAVKNEQRETTLCVRRWLTTQAKNNKKNSSTEQTSLLQRFKNAYKEHGKVLVGVHLVTSAVWFSSFYLISSLAKSDVFALLEKFSHAEGLEKIKSSAYVNVALAYLLYKIATPARYTVTLGGTNLTIKYLRKRGWMAPLKKEDKMQNLFKDAGQEVKHASRRIRKTAGEKSRRGRIVANKKIHEMRDVGKEMGKKAKERTKHGQIVARKKIREIYLKGRSEFLARRERFNHKKISGMYRRFKQSINSRRKKITKNGKRKK